MVIKLIFGITLVSMFSCDTPKIGNTEKLQVTMNMGPATTRVACDSINMVSLKEAYVWVDGTQMRIFANRIMVYNKKY